MKILIVSTLYYPHHLGGAEISTQLLAENLKKTHDVTVLSHGLENNNEEINGIKIQRKFFGTGSNNIFKRINSEKVSVLDKFKGKINDFILNEKMLLEYENFFNNYDIVIISGNVANMGRRNIFKAIKNLNKKSILIIRDPILLYFNDCQPCRWPFLDKMYKLFSFKDLESINTIVSPSKFLMNKHIPYLKKSQKKIIIPNIVDSDKCVYTKFSLKTNSIIYVGAISKRKGCHTLIKAFEKLQKENPSISLKMIGHIEDIEIPENINIEYLGHHGIEETYKLISKSKVLVLPSEWDEAFGRVIVEGIFNSTISIGSNVGGIPEVLNYEEDYLFPKGDSDKLSGILKRVVSFNEREYKVNLDIQKNNCNLFMKENNIKAWNQLLEELEA